MRVVLGSSSPARLQTLRQAGLDPEVVVPDVDEQSVHLAGAPELTAELARIKGEAVLQQLRRDGRADEPLVLFSCDSMLEIEGRVHGKPGTPEAAIVRWYRMRGRQGLLFTGHYVAVVRGDGTVGHQVRVAQTGVTFADLTDAEIAAYAATGEPQRVAGGFTIDGFGGPFVTRISGDPHNVVGISLPLVRQMLLDLGVAWHTLWHNVSQAN
ncbi:Maf family protein [Brooklawnia cerclae]|nr:Maf family protein [Brooklawnia cerclae]